MPRPRTSPSKMRPNTPSSFGKQFQSNMRSPTSIRFTQSRAKSSIEWVEYRSKQLPAPGDYSPQRPSTSGGAFSNARPKSDLDWTILRAKQTPAADAYNLSNGCFNNTSGGRFSTAYPKSYLELEEYRSKQLPSPAEYTPKLMKPNTPCKFNESRPKSYLDWVEYFSKQLPSPNKYRVGGKTRWNCSPEVASGGRFTSSARPSFINDETRRVSDHPAPGDYNITGYRSSVKKRAPRFYDSTSSLTDQINSLDAMMRSPTKNSIGVSPMKRPKERRRTGDAL